MSRNVLRANIVVFFHFRSPERYYNLTLPKKLPPKKDLMPVSQLPMLGYLEQTVSSAIIKSVTSVGCAKPKFPFLSAKRSALLYLAFHLKGIVQVYLIQIT